MTNRICFEAEGLPDAYVHGETIELVITQPVSPTQTAITIPLADAVAWVAEAYVAVTVAYCDHTGTDIELADVAHSGRIITTRLAPPTDLKGAS